MARKTKDTGVPGLSFELSVRPLLYGKPLEAVEPITVEWNQNFAIDWHETHRGTTLGQLFEDVRRRVRQALEVKGRRR